MTIEEEMNKSYFETCNEYFGYFVSSIQLELKKIIRCILNYKKKIKNYLKNILMLINCLNLLIQMN